MVRFKGDRDDTSGGIGLCMALCELFQFKGKTLCNRSNVNVPAESNSKAYKQFKLGTIGS